MLRLLMNNSDALSRTAGSSRKPRSRDRHFAIRQVLNIIFMLMAVVGVCLYLLSDKTVGTIVVLIAIVVKMAECVLRMLR